LSNLNLNLNLTAEKTVNMPTNEEGEFELVLGNKQLLSVFFIFIVLLGLFFSIGYMLGKSSGPADVARKPAAETSARSDAGPSSMPRSGAAAKPIEVAPATPAPKTETPLETPKPELVAAAPAPVVTKTETKAPVAEKTPAKPLEITPVSKPAPTGITQPAPGMYIQVLALDKTQAEVLADVLAKKGFHSMVAPGPNEKIFRVLVGPAKDQADVGRLKGDLEKAGFKEAFPKRY